MSRKLSSSTRYAFALGSVAVATLLRMLLNPFLGAEFPFLTYYFAVVLTTWYAGFSPAIIATILGFVTGNLFLYTHTATEADPLTVIAYMSVTLTIAFLGKSMHESKARLEMSSAELHQKQRELEHRQREFDELLGQERKLQEALELSQKQFQALFENAAVGQAQIEPASGRFLRVNSRLCHLTGYSEEELLTMNVRQITFPADNEWDTHTFRRMIEGQTPDAAIEKRYVAKGGRTVWVNVAAAPVIDKEGHTLSLLSVIQDVTSRRFAEEGLHTAQQKIKSCTADMEKIIAERTVKLTDTIQCLEGFCYIVAHELRTPIHAIHGYAVVLAEKCSLNPHAFDYTQQICHSAMRMDQLVQDLLTYGRLSREPMNCQPLHLEAIVDRVLAQLMGEIAASKCELTVERPLPQALGHPEVLEQALINLIRNAIKFTRNGDTPRVTVRAEVLLSAVRVWVNDNGIGIDPQNHDKIFHLFERIHPASDDTGTGIGLAIVKKGIERMGGRVGLVSLPDSGSNFWLELNKVA